MHQIYPQLYVGPRTDFAAVADNDGWACVRAGFEFYPGAGDVRDDAPPIRNGNLLLLFLRDAPVVIDIPRAPYDAAFSFIDEHLAAGRKVLIHCSQGVSRSASIGLMYLAARTGLFRNLKCKEAIAKFDAIYPPLNLGPAIRAFVEQHWEVYCPADRETAPDGTSH